MQRKEIITAKVTKLLSVRELMENRLMFRSGKSSFWNAENVLSLDLYDGSMDLCL